MVLPGRINPLSVQVGTSQVTPVVPNYHTVRVQHWYDSENKVIPQSPSDRVIGQQKVNDKLYQIAYHSLPWMHPRSQHNRPLLLRIGTLPNGNIITVIPTLRQTECLPDHPILLYRVILDIPQVFLQLSVGVGIAMGNIHTIVVIYHTP